MEEVVMNFHKDLSKLIPNYKDHLTSGTIDILRKIYIAKETEEYYDKKKDLDRLWINNIINLQNSIALGKEDIKKDNKVKKMIIK